MGWPIATPRCRADELNRVARFDDLPCSADFSGKIDSQHAGLGIANFIRALPPAHQRIGAKCGMFILADGAKPCLQLLQLLPIVSENRFVGSDGFRVATEFPHFLCCLETILQDRAELICQVVEFPQSRLGRFPGRGALTHTSDKRLPFSHQEIALSQIGAVVDAAAQNRRPFYGALL